jgi:hypothetical protein
MFGRGKTGTAGPGRLGRLWEDLTDGLSWAARLRLVLIPIAVLVVLYVGAMVWAHRINDDTRFAPGPAFEVAGGSEAVAMATALVDREINETKWVANTPFPFPSSLLDNMPNFQLGLIYAVSRFTIELGDTLGRVRGSSQIDPDLDRATGLLKYDGTTWHWEPSVSLLPTAAAERQYEAGMNALIAYNHRLSGGEATFDKRADNLIAVLDRVAADLGSASASLADHVDNGGWAWFDRTADDAFYAAKGRLYGYAMLLGALGRDFQGVLDERRAESLWQEMLASLTAAAVVDPLIVSNGAPGSLIAPNHLAEQGFFLLRARTQIRELTQVLAK